MRLVIAAPLTIRRPSVYPVSLQPIDSSALSVSSRWLHHATCTYRKPLVSGRWVLVRRAIGRTGRRTTLVKRTFKRISLFSSSLVDDWTGGYLNGTPDRFNECFRRSLGKCVADSWNPTTIAEDFDCSFFFFVFLLMAPLCLDFMALVGPSSSWNIEISRRSYTCNYETLFSTFGLG